MTDIEQHRPSLSRRRALALMAFAMAGLATGCRDRDGAAGAGSRASSGPVRRPEPALADAMAAEAALLARYDAVLRRWPALAGTLGPLRDDHEHHRQALVTAGAGRPAPVSPSPARGLSRRRALRSLLAAERAAAATGLDGCLAAPPALAGLLGSIAACERSHAVVLADVLAGDRR